MTEAEKVARLIALLNQAADETGLTVVGTATSPLALRIVKAAGISRASGSYASPSFGPTVDAAHFRPSEREWVDGAEDRARSDPAWAKQHWGEGRRRAGNERLPGRGPTRLGHTPAELIDFATRGNVPVQNPGTEPVRNTERPVTSCGHPKVEYYYHADEEDRITRCLDCGWMLFERADADGHYGEHAGSPGDD